MGAGRLFRRKTIWYIAFRFHAESVTNQRTTDRSLSFVKVSVAPKMGF
jgi:hypothetical protein